MVIDIFINKKTIRNKYPNNSLKLKFIKTAQ